MTWSLPGRGDAHGASEQVAAQLHHGQAIDLGRLPAFRGDHHRAAADLLQAAPLHACRALDAFLDRAFDVGGADGFGLRLTRPVVGLHQQVAQGAVMGGEFRLVSGQTAGVFDGAGHGTAVQRVQFVAPRHAGEHARVQGVTGLAALEIVLEVGLDLEQLGEVRVVMRQQVIQQTVAHQHHLGRYRDRFGFQADRADQAVEPLQRLDTDLAGEQHALQAVPGHRLHQYPPGVEDQIAAAGMVQGTGADQREVGVQRAVVHVVFNLAGQMLVIGQVLVDHRRPFGFRMVHQQVGAKAGQQRVRGRVILPALPILPALFVVAAAEDLRVFHHVAVDGVELLHHAWQVRPLLLQVVNRIAEGQLHHVLVQRVDLLPQFLAQAGYLLDGLLQLFLQFLGLLLDALAFFLRQLFVFLGVQDLAVTHGREGEAAGGAHQLDVVLVGLLLDLADALVLAFGHLLLQFPQPPLVFVALEGGRDAGAHLLDQILEIIAQLTSFAGRQANRVGAFRPVEVEDMAPVRRDRLAGRAAGEKAAHQVVPVAALGAEHEQVETRAAHARTEFQRAQQPVLATGEFQFFQLFGGVERELLRRAAMVGPFRVQGCRSGHASSP